MRYVCWDVCSRWMGADATLHWVFLKLRTGGWERPVAWISHLWLHHCQQDHRVNKQREIGLNRLFSFDYSSAFEVFASSFKFFSIFHSIISLPVPALLKWLAIWSNVMNRPPGWPLEQSFSPIPIFQRIFRDFLAALIPYFSVAQRVQSQGQLLGKARTDKMIFFNSIDIIQPTRCEEKIQLFYKVVISYVLTWSNL